MRFYKTTTICLLLAALALGYWDYKLSVAVNASIDVITENYLRNIVQDQKDLEQDAVIKEALGVDHEKRQERLFEAFKGRGEVQ